MDTFNKVTSLYNLINLYNLIKSHYLCQSIFILSWKNMLVSPVVKVWHCHQDKISKWDIVTKVESLHHCLESPLVRRLQVQVAVSALLDKVPGEKPPGKRNEEKPPGKRNGEKTPGKRNEDWIGSPDDLPVTVLDPLKLATLWFPSMVERES